MKQDRIFQDRQAALQKAQQEQYQLNQRFNVERAEQEKQYLASQEQLLMEQLPEWKDAGKASAEKDQIRVYLRNTGLNEDQIDNISDHRAILLARKAMLFDKLLKEAPEATKRVEKLPPKVMRPGNKSSDSSETKTAEYQKIMRSKSISLNDAASAFGSIL